jgi:hypothetical protein
MPHTAHRLGLHDLYEFDLVPDKPGGVISIDR